jgi:hypothetical protein
MARSLFLLLAASCALGAPPQDATVETRAYDVRSITTYGAETSWLGTGLGYHNPRRASGQPERIVTVDGESLTALLRDQFPGPIWEETATRSTFRDGRLVLTAPRDLHDKVAAFLRSVTASLGRTLVLDTALVSVDPARLEEVQAGKILQAGTILKTGRVRALPGRHVAVQDVASESYLRDYDVQISTGAGELDPIVSEFLAGTVVDLQPYLDPVEDAVIVDVRGFVQDKEGVDEKKLRLQKDIDVVEGEKDLARKTSTRNALTEVKVQLPRLSIQIVRTTLSIRNRETAVVGAVRRGDAVLYCLVTPTILPSAAGAAGDHRLLDLRGLKEPRWDHVAPRLSVVDSFPGMFVNDEERRDRTFEERFNDLQEAVKEQDLVRDGDRILVLPSAPGAKAEVEKFLSAVRPASLTCEGLVVAFRKGSRAAWEQALDPAKGADADVIAKLRREAAKGGLVRVLETGEVTVLSGQQAYVARLHERAFVQDYEPQVSSLAAIFDPIIGILRTGFVFEVRPHQGQPLLLDVKAGISEGEVKETADPATGLSLVQLSRIAALKWNAEIACAADRWSLVGVESRGQGDALEEVALFVRARNSRPK